MSDSTAASRIKAAALGVALESAALLGFGVVELTTVDRDHPSVALTSGIFFVLYAVGLALSARGLFRLRSWSRGPVVLAQLIQLGVAWSFHGHDTNWVAVSLVVPAVAVLVVVLSAPTTDVLYGRKRAAEDAVAKP